MQVPESLIRKRLSQDLPVVLFCPTPSVDPRFIEMAAAAGYHGAWIDQEHQNYTDPIIANFCVACRAGRIDATVRLRKCYGGSHNRGLEMGAHCLMLPHVNEAAEAAAFVREAKFPPEGNRSADGIEPHSRFGRIPIEEYSEQVNREIVLSVQIEEPAAVDNVGEIAALDGVDVLFVGPGDLSLRYGEFGEDRPLLEAAIDKVAAACREHGKWWGMPAADVQAAQQRMTQGARFFVSGSMFGFAHKAFTEFREAFGPLL